MKVKVRPPHCMKIWNLISKEVEEEKSVHWKRDPAFDASAKFIHAKSFNDLVPRRLRIRGQNKLFIIKVNCDQLLLCLSISNVSTFFNSLHHLARMHTRCLPLRILSKDFVQQICLLQLLKHCPSQLT
ncbi:hypothetical protein TNCT_654441 [Trichonephila clavata]|uniref:Uncharacterized protein n=1 Tax=Trichonephila clavata TaxID=2740835 RepID=A0A8X6FBA2_TRICU|nr:hypothetical protein TNCT_654441 [Trichonephila clavata]